MLLSIIVPVYNVEQYLIRCIDSLLHQGIAPDEYEIILVNDGSTDGSGTICDQYAMEHRHIRVIHKDNGGASDARNRGMETSVGKYIAFVDSDDYLMHEAYTTLLAEAERCKADVTIGRLINCYEDGCEDTYTMVASGIYNGKEVLTDAIKGGTYCVYPVLGIYKRELLLNNNLFFYEGIVCEDELWTTQVYIKSNVVCSANLNFYYYCHRTGSVTNQPDKYNISLSLATVVRQLAEWLGTVELTTEERQWINDYMCTLYLNGFYVGKCYLRDRRGYIKRKLPIRLAHSKKNKAKAWLFAISPTIYYFVNKITKMLIKTH